MQESQNEDLRLREAKKFRKRFIIKAYSLFTVYVLLTIIQWILVLLSDDFSLFLIEHVELCLVSFFIALILMTVFVFVETVRTVPPLNWFLAWIIFEALVLGLSRIVAVTCFEALGISLALVIIPFIIFVLIATFVRHDFTLDVIILFVTAFICFVGAVYFVTLYVVGQAFFAYVIFTTMIYMVVCMFVMYHAQTINGSRYAEMRLGDYFLASLILYIDFLILFMVTIYAVRLSWNIVSNCGIKHAEYLKTANSERYPRFLGVKDGTSNRI